MRAQVWITRDQSLDFPDFNPESIFPRDAICIFNLTGGAPAFPTPPVEELLTDAVDFRLSVWVMVEKPDVVGEGDTAIGEDCALGEVPSAASFPKEGGFSLMLSSGGRFNRFVDCFFGIGGL